MTNSQDIRQSIPSVDSVLQESQDLIDEWGHRNVSESIRLELQQLRKNVNKQSSADCNISSIRSSVQNRLSENSSDGIRPVINLSGVVLHTNLGRACLPTAAADAARLAGLNPTNLEYDLKTGQRGNRDSHIESLICELTGCEAATVVNNNAAAVLLVLNTLAKGREVPVSRGELVEIGGAFRMPEIMASSGCTLVEVGSTNRTHLKDYRDAISEKTALLMKVHTSNYRIEGFTQSIDENDLSQLAHEHNLPCILDLGSGCLVDFLSLGLPAEPNAASYLRTGVDLITFSGDKLLGGPQCGIIAGKKTLLEKICNNPLKRTLRQDAMTLAALAEVLKLYRHPKRLLQELPTLRQLTRNSSHIEAQARRLATALTGCLPDQFKVDAEPCHSQIGSGALPVETIASFAICIQSKRNLDQDLTSLAATLRQLPTPIIGRIHDGKLLLDCRCLDDEALFVEQLDNLRESLSCS
mgnify:FL=1